MEKLFGTDGIRGRANEWPLMPEFVTRIGSAIATVLSQSHQRSLALIGCDTRARDDRARARRGLIAQGLDVHAIGVLPTPGIAFLTRVRGNRCGISISASHNLYQDNGIKIGAEKRHAKLWITDGAATLEAVWWGVGDGALPVGRFDLAFAPQINEFNGATTVQLKVLDWRPAA